MNPRLLLAVLLALTLVHMSGYGACVQDDAFISFRYAANLLDGHGLVYNPGEPVEGYTNFLWTLLIAGAMAMGAGPVMASVVGGMASAVALAWGGHRLADDAVSSPWIGLIVPCFVVLDTGTALEGMQGLETVFYAALLTWALVWTGRELRDPSVPPVSALLLGLAALTRPEGAVIFGCLGVGRLLLAGRLERRLVAGIGLFALFVGGHLAFRLAYYGQPVPNTFYAKVGAESAQVLRGGTYLLGFARAHIVLAASGLAGLGLVLVRWRRTAPILRIVAVLCLLYLLYVGAVGGDFKATYRFVIPVLVPLAVLAAHAVATVGGRRARVGAAAVALAALAVDLPRQLPAARAAAGARMQDMDDRLLIGAWIRANIPADAVLAIHSAGTIPYAAGLPTIDMWGLSDPTIARREVEDMGAGTAGHEKTDYRYTFAQDPYLYLPEEQLLTDAPVRLPVPSDFPADFEQRYRPATAVVGNRHLNFFVRATGRP
ncbi:MAG: hypothetical protein VX265_10075 [Myxococcota bacterium]|nr:hypothetical protein [Myxococcota bacterium]